MFKEHNFSISINQRDISKNWFKRHFNLFRKQIDYYYLELSLIPSSERLESHGKSNTANTQWFMFLFSNQFCPGFQAHMSQGYHKLKFTWSPPSSPFPRPEQLGSSRILGQEPCVTSFLFLLLPAVGCCWNCTLQFMFTVFLPPPPMLLFFVIKFKNSSAVRSLRLNYAPALICQAQHSWKSFAAGKITFFLCVSVWRSRLGFRFCRGR